MATEVKAYPAYGMKQPTVIVNDSEIPTFEGRLAIKLVEHFGIIAAEDAGEDSAGRKQLRLMEPHDVVLRACDIAELMTEALRTRGWMVKGLTMSEAEEQAAALVKREREKV